MEIGRPGLNELLVRHTAIGVNLHDTHACSESYRTLALPGIPGVEAAGVVEEAGPNTLGFSPGHRIAYIDRVMVRIRSCAWSISQIVSGISRKTAAASCTIPSARTRSWDRSTAWGMSFDQPSGAVEPLSVSQLAVRPTTLVRPYLFHYIRERASLEALARETYDTLASQIIRAEIGLRCPLAEAADAHRAIESRTTYGGATVLIP